MEQRSADGHRRLACPYLSPVIHEIDVIEVPEPATLSLPALGGWMAMRRRRRR